MSEFVPALDAANIRMFQVDDISVVGPEPYRSYPDNSARDAALQANQGGLPVSWDSNQPTPPEMTLARSVSLAIKRLVDIVGALIGLVAVGPLLLGIAAIICLTDPGPALFRQKRVGLNGKTFHIFKFRSMYLDQCDDTGVVQTTASDNRVTPIGRFIRKTSIDELPQLLNVLNGEMSLVGPRPHVANMLAGGTTYEQLSPHYQYRSLMRPGITGWAQCNQLRGSTADEGRALARLGHDIAYIQNYSLALDAKVLWRTIRSEFLTGAAH